MGDSVNDLIAHGSRILLRRLLIFGKNNSFVWGHATLQIRAEVLRHPAGNYFAVEAAAFICSKTASSACSRAAICLYLFPCSN